MGTKFPDGIVWRDVFCRGSCAADFNWGHLPDASGACQRCEYVRPQRVTEILAGMAQPLTVTTARHPGGKGS